MIAWLRHLTGRNKPHWCAHPDPVLHLTMAHRCRCSVGADHDNRFSPFGIEL